MRAIDLCCGAGGWAVAARGLPIEIVLAVDWWEPACRTYSINHPATTVIRADITKGPIDVSRLVGTVDLVLGAIPCQWLVSHRNINAARPDEISAGQAVLDSCLAIVRAIEPRWWCLEDVIQLRHQLPILTPYQVIDSLSYSGQRRKRLYVGDFPRPTAGQCDRVLADYLRSGPYRIGRSLWGRVPATHRAFAPGKCSGAYPDRKARAVLAINSRRDSAIGVVGDYPGGIRQFEWQECAALQGYPDDYVFWGSPTDVGVMIGNSIQIDTGRAILRAMCDAC